MITKEWFVGFEFSDAPENSCSSNDELLIHAVFDRVVGSALRLSVEG
jgi:hypothetical protein